MMKARLPTPLLAIAGMIGPVFFLTLVIVQGILQPDYHQWAGLLQRVLVVVWVACQLVIGRRLLSIAGQQPVASSSAA